MHQFVTKSVWFINEINQTGFVAILLVLLSGGRERFCSKITNISEVRAVEDVGIFISTTNWTWWFICQFETAGMWKSRVVKNFQFFFIWPQGLKICPFSCWNGMKIQNFKKVHYSCVRKSAARHHWWIISVCVVFFLFLTASYS